MPVVQADSLLGRTIAGKILIEGLVGRGAMGSVYRGRHLTLDEIVAVKVMHAGFATDPEFSERFRREATTMVRLKHPNSVRVLDFGQEPDGLLYLAMEYLDGRDLGALMRAEFPLSPARIAHLLRQALAALQAAHDADIIHRDLKPENILVVTDRDEDGAPTEVAKVCDFGIAKIRESRSEHPPAPGASPSRPQRLTTAGLVVGTPEYMSPEQGRAEPLDARSDLYSVGVILYELLTGRVPFEAESPVAIIVKHVSDKVVPPSELVPGVDATLEAICMKALAKAPGDRFATAREMRAALREVDDVAPSTTRAPIVFAKAPQGGTQTSLHVDVARRGTAQSAPTQSAIATAADGAPAARSPRARWAIGGAVVLAAIGAVVVSRFAREPAPALRALELASIAIPNVPATAAPIAPPVVASTVAPTVADTATPDPRPSAPTARADLPLAIRGAPSAAPTASDPPPATSPAPSVVAPPVAAPPPPPPDPTPSAAPPPVAPPPPPPPAFDPATASVALAGVSNAEGVLKSAVASAIGRTTGAMTGCYRAELRNATTREVGRGSLHLETDDSGIVVSASANVPFSASVARCVERAVRGVRFTGVDTGNARADVALDFQVR